MRMVLRCLSPEESGDHNFSFRTAVFPVFLICLFTCAFNFLVIFGSWVYNTALKYVLWAIFWSSILSLLFSELYHLLDVYSLFHGCFS